MDLVKGVEIAEKHGVLHRQVKPRSRNIEIRVERERLRSGCGSRGGEEDAREVYQFFSVVGCMLGGCDDGVSQEVVHLREPAGSSVSSCTCFAGYLLCWYKTFWLLALLVEKYRY